MRRRRHEDSIRRHGRRAYIELLPPAPASVQRTVHVTDEIGVDIGFDGSAVGIVILDARAQLGLQPGRLEVSIEQATAAAGTPHHG